MLATHGGREEAEEGLGEARASERVSERSQQTERGACGGLGSAPLEVCRRGGSEAGHPRVLFPWSSPSPGHAGGVAQPVLRVFWVSR